MSFPPSWDSSSLKGKWPLVAKNNIPYPLSSLKAGYTSEMSSFSLFPFSLARSAAGCAVCLREPYFIRFLNFLVVFHALLGGKSFSLGTAFYLKQSLYLNGQTWL